MNSLGERIAFYRKKMGLTQEQLAEKCSVSAQAVSKWENDITSPDIMLIAPLAGLFGVSCDELLGARRTDVGRIDPDLVDTGKTLLKIKVKSVKGDDVNVNLPVSLAEVLLKSGSACLGEKGNLLAEIDFEQIITLIKAGVVGKLVDIKSAAGDVVEVWVE